MKVISTGAGYRIYDNSLKAYDQLPAQAYTIGFNPQEGFSLMRYTDLSINEKTYGVHESKVSKVMNAFERSPRNLGVILSGDKGIGKSLFAKMLAIESINQGMPVIIVEGYIPGVAGYINSIEQPCAVLFDEFDKTFGGGKDENGNRMDPQTEMLTLFDGMSSGKKLFIVTCNDLRNLNSYLVNRPGRFHYHFRFDYPQAAEIKEYLGDKGIAASEIEKVVGFSLKVKLNYDCLRSIAFELMTGDTFEDAIKDLNIINMEGERYKVTVFFKNGQRVRRQHHFDMFSDEETTIEFSEGYDDIGDLRFTPSDAHYDVSLGGYVVSGDDLHWEFDRWITNPDNEHLDKDEIALKEKWKGTDAIYAVITHCWDKSIHYAV